MVTLSGSSATRSITIQPLDVATSITISAPSSAKKGASFTISGILIRNDTGGPVPSASISLSYNGTSLGSATTGVDGDYLRTVSIGAEGTFTLKASFAGGSGYAASTAQRSVSVREEVLPPAAQIIPILAPLITGVIILKAGKVI